SDRHAAGRPLVPRAGGRGRGRGHERGEQDGGRGAEGEGGAAGAPREGVPDHLYLHVEVGSPAARSAARALRRAPDPGGPDVTCDLNHLSTSRTAHGPRVATPPTRHRVDTAAAARP